MPHFLILSLKKNEKTTYKKITHTVTGQKKKILARDKKGPAY
jgi:hypothetical protein